MAGRAAALAILTFLLVPLGAVFWRAGGGAMPDVHDWAAVRFTLWQAALSAVASTLLAVPVARAVARRRFPGRGALIALMGAPFILPVIVAVIGLIAVYGRGGLVNDLLGLACLPPPGDGRPRCLSVSIYGLHGVVLAHVFFNLPLAVRLILQGWLAIPAERFRLAAHLGAGPGDVQRLLEWPMLRATLPGVVLIVFAICLSSFAVALTLGGGPRATTVELAIYQAFTYDFDLARAAMLSLVQLLLVTGAGLLALRLGRTEGFGAGLDRRIDMLPPGGRALWLGDAAWMTVAALFLLLPLGAVAVRGLSGLAEMPPSVWGATGNSLAIALSATLLTVSVALALALARRGWVDLAGMAPLAASPLVLGTGLFLLINPVARPVDWALVVTLAVNVAMALPFVLRIVLPAAQEVERSYGRLADSLGMRGMARLRWLILPRMRRPLGFAAGLTAALSMGDLGVIALFSDPDKATLPLTVFRLMGAYRTEAAAGAALLLLVLSFGLFLIFDLGGRGAATR
ncbi:thiamine/thiamine pyrophosphate ABC transporter permease ThiP [Pseudooceanicola sp. 216_PA32_1]|uniref:Thiamine/thiamine pyrophosphate ABC transporter permease ThiP n=2 Tax=Pseudooceanicola pacificus TaxID=2676438 RepID=A0A844WFS1_9RHOB|nr:thiamine/thiamine pyrophosphate ABC transporter permease ThiP [Pseudooceanicola pacificus]MWB79390.1 thiamine/thiamine pyrophosphate ABC transporter permease ThiP [Pseudooceanicola pacificus]